jgi:hypothetical protein
VVWAPLACVHLCHRGYMSKAPCLPDSTTWLASFAEPSIDRSCKLNGRRSNRSCYGHFLIWSRITGEGKSGATACRSGNWSRMTCTLRNFASSNTSSAEVSVRFMSPPRRHSQRTVKPCGAWPNSAAAKRVRVTSMAASGRQFAQNKRPYRERCSGERPTPPYGFQNSYFHFLEVTR